MNRPSKIIFVTGTDTDVGKTIATAALAAALVARGRTVAVYKPAQAGTYDGQGDIDVVRRLAGLTDVHEGIRLADAMAPVAAAARAGVQLPPVQAHVAAIQQLAAARDHTLVEGAGGLLVALDHDSHTLADIAVATGPSAAAVIVCRAGLGTLNHTELTIEALARRGIAIRGLVIGSWPRHPTDVDISNRDYLSRHAVPVIGIIPEGAGTLTRAEFTTSANSWFRASGQAARPGTAYLPAPAMTGAAEMQSAVLGLVGRTEEKTARTWLPSTMMFRPAAWPRHRTEPVARHPRGETS